MSEKETIKALVEQIQSLNNELVNFMEKQYTTIPRSMVMSEDNVASLQESMKDLLISLSCDMYWVYDPQINRVKFSKPFCDELGWLDLSDISLTKFLDFVPLMYRSSINASFYNLMHCTSSVEEFDYQFSRDDGTKEWYHAKCSFVANEQKNVVKIIGINNNITKSKLKNEMILQEQAKNEMLIGLANNLIWEYDCKEHTFTGNASLYNKLGLQHKKYTYNEVKQLHQNDTPLRLEELVQEEKLSGGSVIHIYSEREKGYLSFEANFGSLRDSDGETYRIIGTLDDITEKELLMATAARDPLTNVYNRRMGNLRLKSIFQKYREDGEFYTIIFFDIDKFKFVNDTFGHDMGDFVLKAICSTITSEIRSTDMLFRWGGDELLLICSGIMKENIYAYIDRIRVVIENNKYEYNGEILHLTVSIGAAYFYKNDEDEQQAVKRADRSLYKAKLAGRNKVCILL